MVLRTETGSSAESRKRTNHWATSSSLYRIWKCILLSGRIQSRKAAQCVIQITWHSGKGKTTEWKHLQLLTQRSTVGETGRGLWVSEWWDYSARHCEGGQGRAGQAGAAELTQLPTTKHEPQRQAWAFVNNSVWCINISSPVLTWETGGVWVVRGKSVLFCLFFLETYKTALKTKVYSFF